MIGHLRPCPDLEPSVVTLLTLRATSIHLVIPPHRLAAWSRTAEIPVWFTYAAKEEAWRQLSTVIERDPMVGTGYQIVADAFERHGRVGEAIAYWQQAIVIDQTTPTTRLRKAQALIALGRTAEGDALLSQIATTKWHDMWSGVAYQARDLLARGKRMR